MKTENNQINNLEIQSIFVGCLIIASSINLLIINMYKDMIINKSSSKYTSKQIYDLAKLVASIFLIVTIYFYIDSYENYSNSNTKANYNYYMAASLSFIAQSIRINTLIKYPDTILGSEDII